MIGPEQPGEADAATTAEPGADAAATAEPAADVAAAEPALEPAPEPAPEPMPAPTPASPDVVGSGYELPTARQVVGRGFQLALDASRDIRRASIYVGLLFLATVGPVVVLGVAELPLISRLFADIDPVTGLPEDPEAITILTQVYSVGLLAALGAVAATIDGSLAAVALLGARAAGRPMTLREAIERARQVFWRYLGAAIIVGIISLIGTVIAGAIDGAYGPSTSLGASLLSSLVGTIVAAPFGYILTAIVIGDVSATTAVGRSLTLARARPALVVVIAAFTFLAQAIQLFGLSAALDVVGEAVDVLHVQIDLGGAQGLLIALLGGVGLVAYGSLTITVGAISAAPQVAAFLGLTHFSAGLDRARTTTAVMPPATSEPLAPELVASDSLAGAEPTAPLPPSPPEPATPVRPTRTRWVTRPMLALIVLTVVLVVLAIVGTANQA